MNGTRGTTELQLKGISLHKETGLPWVLFEDPQTSWALGLEIGPFEANAILVQLEGLRPARPLTHDLLSQVLQMNQMKPLNLEFYDMDAEGRILARMPYAQGWKTGVLEVRPSDGLALAVRLDIPILVHRPLIEPWVAFQESQGALQHLKTDLYYRKSSPGSRARV